MNLIFKYKHLQACRGGDREEGTNLEVVQAEADSISIQQSYKIPNYADFFIAYSTFPGKIFVLQLYFALN